MIQYVLEGIISPVLFITPVMEKDYDHPKFQCDSMSFKHLL